MKLLFPALYSSHPLSNILKIYFPVPVGMIGHANTSEKLLKQMLYFPLQLYWELTLDICLSEVERS
jgi:hypothetical protein